MNANKYQLKEFSITFWENSAWWLSGKEPSCSIGGSDFRISSLGLEDPLGEEMATHSSVLAWEISRTEEPGRLQSMESQKSRMSYSCWVRLSLRLGSFILEQVLVLIYPTAPLNHLQCRGEITKQPPVHRQEQTPSRTCHFVQVHF